MEQRRRRRRNSEEEVKPKRVRGSRTSDSKEVATVNPKTRERKERTALETHDYDSILRLQNYPDFHTMLDAKSLTNLIGRCYSSTRGSVERMINDPRTTIGELQAIVLSTDAIDSDSNSRLRSKIYSDSRLFGKTADRVELTGAGGKAIEMETSEKTKSIKDLPRDELQILIRAMEIATKDKDDESDDSDK